MVIHEIAPVYDENSKILILGTMPSPKSRQAGFYYMHPQNRFWRVLGRVLNEDFSCGIEGKKRLLLKRHIALWDVLFSCDINKASDSSIKNPVPNDLEIIFSAADIKNVYLTGTTAYRLYKRFFKRAGVLLPSTSAANCRVSTEKLFESYSVILEDLTDETGDFKA